MKLLHKDLMSAYSRAPRSNSQTGNSEYQIDRGDNGDGNEIYGICIDDLDSRGQLMVDRTTRQEVQRSCETDEVILSMSDKKLWVNKIVNKGLQKLVYGKYMERKYVGWNKSYKHFSVEEGIDDDNGDEWELEVNLYNGGDTTFSLTNVRNL